MRQQINSRFDLAQYCLRKLGAPIIRINITEEQIDDRINDALDMFLQFHMDGSYRGVYVHNLTQEDIDTKKISLPETIMSVIDVYLTTDPSMNSMTAGNNLQMQAYFSDLISYVPMPYLKPDHDPYKKSSYTIYRYTAYPSLPKEIDS